MACDPHYQGHSVLLVQEYCCTDLAQMLSKASERFPEAVVKGILLQILRGVWTCHRAGEICRWLNERYHFSLVGSSLLVPPCA